MSKSNTLLEDLYKAVLQANADCIGKRGPELRAAERRAALACAEYAEAAQGVENAPHKRDLELVTARNPHWRQFQ